MSQRLPRSGLIVMATLVALFAPPAGAHAALDQSVPAASSVVNTAPKDLTLRFTERLEPAFSRVTVLDSKGKRVDQGAQVEAADATLLRVTLPALPAGRYRVQWRVLSIDAHVTEGAFTFDVAR